jgi:hypothetical protein
MRGGPIQSVGLKIPNFGTKARIYRTRRQQPFDFGRCGPGGSRRRSSCASFAASARCPVRAAHGEAETGLVQIGIERERTP